MGTIHLCWTKEELSGMEMLMQTVMTHQRKHLFWSGQVRPRRGRSPTETVSG